MYLTQEKEKKTALICLSQMVKNDSSSSNKKKYH